MKYIDENEKYTRAMIKHQTSSDSREGTFLLTWAHELWKMSDAILLTGVLLRSLSSELRHSCATEMLETTGARSHELGLLARLTTLGTELLVSELHWHASCRVACNRWNTSHVGAHIRMLLHRHELKVLSESLLVRQ